MLDLPQHEIKQDSPAGFDKLEEIFPPPTRWQLARPLVVGWSQAAIFGSGLLWWLGWPLPSSWWLAGLLAYLLVLITATEIAYRWLLRRRRLIRRKKEIECE